MEKPELVRISQTGDSATQITAQLPSKEALKSMFTLLVGNPDSMIKIFNKPMIVDKNDIDKLDEQVCNKLGIHQIEASKTTFDLTLSDNTVLEFDRWRGAAVNFALPQYVTGLAIRWDFMVRLPNYSLPQRHVLTVRIGAGSINIARLMQAAFSRDPDEADKYHLSNSPLYCRVDFINQILSQELINTVDAWHKGTREATGLLPKWLRKDWAQQSLDIFLKYSVPIWVAIVSAVSLFKHFQVSRLTQPLLVGDFRDALAWIFISAISIVGLFVAFRQVARRSSHFMMRHMPQTRFELTNGDTNRHDVQKRKAINKIVKYCAAFFFAVVCNIVAAYIFARMFSSK